MPCSNGEMKKIWGLKGDVVWLLLKHKGWFGTNKETQEITEEIIKLIKERDFNTD